MLWPSRSSLPESSSMRKGMVSPCASDKQLVNSYFSDTDKKAKASPGRKRSIRTGLSGTKIKNLLHRQGMIPQLDCIEEAYVSYVVFKPLFTGLPFNISRESRDEMVNLASKSAVDAFKLVDNELRFVYDLFFTKNPIQYQNLKVCLFLRSFCLLSAVFTLIAFTSVVDRRKHSPVDIAITYMLMGGAISLDAYSYLVHSLSRWAIIWKPTCLHKLYAKLVSFRLKLFKPSSGIKLMAQHNLIKFCVKATPGCFTSVVKLVDTGNLLLKNCFTKWIPVSTEMKNFIYDYLKDKPKQSVTSNDRLDHELKSVFKPKIMKTLSADADLENLEELVSIFCRMDSTNFIRSIFIWRIATALAYYDDKDNDRIGGARSLCNISNSLSDYMIYLALVCPAMLSEGFVDVINAKIFMEAQVFLREKRKSNVEKVRKQFTSDLLSFGTYQQQSYYKPPRKGLGHVLQEGADLAASLQKLVGKMRWDVEEKWRMVSEVWMEIFIYAANHCSWKEHAQQLRHGGELLTHVALLMAHLGLTTKVTTYHEDYASDAFPPFDD